MWLKTRQSRVAAVRKLFYALPFVMVIVAVKLMLTAPQTDLNGTTPGMVESTPTPIRQDYLGPLTKEETLINQYRINVKHLTHNPQLEQSAQNRARLLAQGKTPWSHDQYFEHVSSYYVNQGNGYFTGETLARDFSTFDEVLEAWINSDSHRAVLLSDTACEFGLGYFQGYWVLHVGCTNYY